MTSVWQVDFYRRPLVDESGSPLWELLVCSPDHGVKFWAFCAQKVVGTEWLREQFRQAAGMTGGFPQVIQVFRPACLSLIESAARPLGVNVEPTRRTLELKQWLWHRSQDYIGMAGFTGESYDPLALDQSPPVPLPTSLWGDRWRFARIPAANVASAFADRPLPFRNLPETLLPMNLGIASATPIPGVVIDGGRQSLRLAQWLQAAAPWAIAYQAGAPDGLILEAGLADRWVLATFDDPEIRQAGQLYEQRKQESRGLHFLLVQPDDSGMTYTGFWLLRQDEMLAPSLALPIV